MKIYFTPIALASVLVLACNGKDPETGETDGSTSNPTTTSDSASSTSSDSATATATTTTTTTTTSGTMSSSSSSTGETGSFITEKDIPSDNECDVFSQDCPRGQKCLPWAKDGGGSWNATKCSDVGPEPGIDGDKCTVEGSAVSGIDSCDVGFICWFVNDMNEGTCIPQCMGTADAPDCPNGKTCDISNGGVINICLQECDPVIVDCPEGLICFPSSSGSFICDFDASGDTGGYLDPCEYVNVCDPGLFCADASVVPGCMDGIGCCTEFCDITVDNPDTQCSGQDMGAACVAWYNEGEAPAGLEHVGACIIPP